MLLPCINVTPLQSVPQTSSSMPSLAPGFGYSASQTTAMGQSTNIAFTTDTPSVVSRSSQLPTIQFGTLPPITLQRDSNNGPCSSSGSKISPTLQRNGTTSGCTLSHTEANNILSPVTRKTIDKRSSSNTKVVFCIRKSVNPSNGYKIEGGNN